jgi:outer membrane receptor protein involved in Fe transport
MKLTTSRLATLMGSASLLTIASALAAHAQQVAQTQMAQAAPQELPEQVLVTGSLIHGTAAVGVTVTNLGAQDFKQIGALTTADLFKTIPAADVSPGAVATNSTSNIARGTRVNIRGLDNSTGVRTLLMIDGMRFMPQAFGCTLDPSLIPAISLERIDVLVDGASATYGSDAVAGVINIILKRGYEGATTELRYSTAKGKNIYQASQLWGRSWDGGNITLSYEWHDASPIKGNVHSNLTVDYSPWGLDNRTPLGSSIPGTISLGAPATTLPSSYPAGLGSNCTNCFAIPAGTGGNFNPINGGLGPTAPFSASTLNWATFNTPANSGTNGTHNEFNPYTLGWYSAAEQRNGGALTIDQRLTKDITFSGEAFYSNRRSEYLVPIIQTPASTGILTIAVPTYNPYYPTGGAPTNLRVSYNTGLENPSFDASFELAARYMGALNVDLPGDWTGKIYYSETYDNNFDHANTVNSNAVSAALGWTINPSPAVGSAPSFGTWTKPASVPYLNLFCDPRQYNCNSRQTLDYMSAIRLNDLKYWINEKGVNLDGPLFSLPGGEVKAAFGATYTSSRFTFRTLDNTGSPTLIVPIVNDAQARQVWAAFTQVNIPLFSEMNAIPLFRKLELEASWRHDQYSDVGGTSNPKIAFDWSPIEDLTFKGSWGTSFRAPSFAEKSTQVKNALLAQNTPFFFSTTGSAITCNPVAGSASDKLINPGAGLTGWSGVVANNGTAGQNCGSGALPTGLALIGSGGAAINADLRKYVNTFGATLHPETATNWGFGFDYAPTKFLKGLDIQATWYQVKINGPLQSFINPNTQFFNNPGLGFTIIVPTDIAKAGIDVAGCSNNNTPAACPEFENMVQKLLDNPRNGINPAVKTSVLWINDGGIFNAGYTKLSGIDFNVSYDWDMGNIGAFNTGVTGTYYLHRYEQQVAGAVPQDQFHINLGSAGGLAMNGVESLPRMHYRARLGWSSEKWSVTGFVNYDSHFYHTQNAPPNVNNQCITAGGTTGGGSQPCAISNYSNLEPSFYTFDLSTGYNTGDDPANDYLKHLGIQLVVQNLMDRQPAFEYRILALNGNPAAFDILKSAQGRTISLILTKTW